jgi:hypothetical protein
MEIPLYTGITFDDRNDLRRAKSFRKPGMAVTWGRVANLGELV